MLLGTHDHFESVGLQSIAHKSECPALILRLCMGSSCWTKLVNRHKSMSIRRETYSTKAPGKRSRLLGLLLTSPPPLWSTAKSSWTYLCSHSQQTYHPRTGYRLSVMLQKMQLRNRLFIIWVTVSHLWKKPKGVRKIRRIGVSKGRVCWIFLILRKLEGNRVKILILVIMLFRPEWATSKPTPITAKSTTSPKKSFKWRAFLKPAASIPSQEICMTHSIVKYNLTRPCRVSWNLPTIRN